MAEIEHGPPADEIRRYAQLLLDGALSPSEAGIKIWQTAMSVTSQDHFHALWLIWGGLTDWLELKPEDAGTAEREMRRAAAEWLEVALHPSRRKEYCDRWIREMGYY